MIKSFSGVTALHLTTSVHDVATFNALLSCPAALRYSNQFTNGSATMKIRPQKRRFCEFNGLPWQRPLSDHQMKQIYQALK